ncbi:MAG TPA: hypothetical protein VMT15_07125 [Bryobacteraceae bacterium]|nr:hypothetical protein [Bryobacteraceae bacterium]
MNFPKFWARGQSKGFSVWRWSDRNFGEAKSEAQAAAERLAAQFAAHELPDQRYGYGNRPMREPVLREMRDAAGQLAHAITRNSYGCQVLNSAVALFVDVDLPEQKPKAAGLFGSLFGRKGPEPEDPAKPAMGQAAAWAQAHRGWNWRIYRTRGGLRLLATHALFDTSDPVCEQVFAALGADPLYRKLCQTQKCFRARLTPKHWRCQPAVGHPPARWPFESAAEEKAFTDWDAKYRAACQAKATCQLLDAGPGPVHPELREVVALHDGITRALSPGFELA